MNFLRYVLLMLLSGVIAFSANNCANSDGEAKSQIQEEPTSILIFTKTEGFRHQSIPDGVDAVKEIASENGLDTFHTEDAGYFQADSLARFDIVLFLSTTGDILNEKQQQAFEQFIGNGGGFVGIHAAADTEYEWPWYGDLVGAYFKNHPEIQEARVEVVDKEHPSTSHLPDEWIRTDEWYNYKNINPAINTLMTLDESSYEGGENGDPHPIAWYHEVEGSPVFYTGGGHTSESYDEPQFLEHLWGGIKYVSENVES